MKTGFRSCTVFFIAVFFGLLVIPHALRAEEVWTMTPGFPKINPKNKDFSKRKGLRVDISETHVKMRRDWYRGSKLLGGDFTITGEVPRVLGINSVFKITITGKFMGKVGKAHGVSFGIRCDKKGFKMTYPSPKKKKWSTERRRGVVVNKNNRFESRTFTFRPIKGKNELTLALVYGGHGTLILYKWEKVK